MNIPTEPEPAPAQTAREWVEEKKRNAQVIGAEVIIIKDALELADRADRSEAELAARKATELTELAILRAERDTLRAALDSFILAAETLRTDRASTDKDTGQEWSLQTVEWAEWFVEKTNEAREALNQTNK